MKIVVAIIAYNRIDNINHWLSCWDKCEHEAELIVIQNRDDWNNDLHMFLDYDKYKLLLRPNIGYDTGAFQDICRNRLPYFPEYDRLLWITDDVFCMSTDFFKQFNDAMQPGVGCAAMQISLSVKKHIRTSAFMIDRHVAERLTFPADPITTKRQCYEFEHMAKDAFYEQVINMGLKVVQVAPNNRSPLWDSGFIGKLPRAKEHEKIFGAIPEQPKYISKAIHLKSEL